MKTKWMAIAISLVFLVALAATPSWARGRGHNQRKHNIRQKAHNPGKYASMYRGSRHNTHHYKHGVRSSRANHHRYQRSVHRHHRSYHRYDRYRRYYRSYHRYNCYPRHSGVFFGISIR